MNPDPAETDYPARLRRADVPSALRPLMLSSADEIERLRTALQAMYDRYATDEDGWAVEPECHLLARRALGLNEQLTPEG